MSYEPGKPLNIVPVGDMAKVSQWVGYAKHRAWQLLAEGLYLNKTYVPEAGVTIRIETLHGIPRVTITAEGGGVFAIMWLTYYPTSSTRQDFIRVYSASGVKPDKVFTYSDKEIFGFPVYSPPPYPYSTVSHSTGADGVLWAYLSGRLYAVNKSKQTQTYIPADIALPFAGSGRNFMPMRDGLIAYLGGNRVAVPANVDTDYSDHINAAGIQVCASDGSVTTKAATLLETPDRVVSFSPYYVSQTQNIYALFPLGYNKLVACVSGDYPFFPPSDPPPTAPSARMIISSDAGDTWSLVTLPSEIASYPITEYDGIRGVYPVRDGVVLMLYCALKTMPIGAAPTYSQTRYQYPPEPIHCAISIDGGNTFSFALSAVETAPQTDPPTYLSLVSGIPVGNNKVMLLMMGFNTGSTSVFTAVIEVAPDNTVSITYNPAIDEYNALIGMYTPSAGSPYPLYTVGQLSQISPTTVVLPVYGLFDGYVKLYATQDLGGSWTNWSTSQTITTDYMLPDTAGRLDRALAFVAPVNGPHWPGLPNAFSPPSS